MRTVRTQKSLLLRKKHAERAGSLPLAFDVDGVTVVYCTTYAEAEALIREMIADAGGKPVALDLETCPLQSERERLAALLEEREAVNAEAIAFRKAAKKAVTPQAEIDAYTETANAKLKALDARSTMPRAAGLDPQPIRDPAPAGLWRRAPRRGRRHRQGRRRGPRAAAGRLRGHSWRALRSRPPRPSWRQSGEGARHPASRATDDRREQVLARRGGQTLSQGRPR